MDNNLNSALDISKFVLNYYRDRNIAISNLKLQKLLYFIQAECLKQLNVPCFKDDIQAWKHGPVVPDVYFNYNSYLAGPILSTLPPKEEISANKQAIIINVLDKYKNTLPWDLVEITHKQESWKKMYRPDENNIVIPVSLIKETYKGT